jgi:hypothetical protein
MAVLLAESECILPLDSDDLLADDEVLEIMYNTWLVDQTKIIYGNLQMYTQVANNIFQRGKVISLGEYTFELAMNLNGIMPVTGMHSRECHYEAGGWKHEMDAGLEDVEYWIAAGKRGYCGRKISDTTLIYRRHGKSRAHKMQFELKNFSAMQQKIKDLHSDIYTGRFPVACCGGKGASAAPANDPIILSRAAQSDVRIVTTLDGYDEKNLEWVAYRGPKQGRSGSIIARGPTNTPAEYPILGTGHVFQIHKAHRKLFEDRQRLGFVMNEPDPRKQPEPEPLSAPVEPVPQVIEVPPPELSTVVQLDPVAARTREIEIQPFPEQPEQGEIITTEPVITDKTVNWQVTNTGSEYHLADLRLGPKTTNTLRDAGYTIEKLAETTPQKLSVLPGIGIKGAKAIIAKAQEFMV